MHEFNGAAGLGHLTALATQPANDADGIASLPYTIYYPEGYANGRASTFVPIVNPNAVAARVIVVARYETGVRDEVIFDEVTPGNSRGGFTITTPELYANDTLLVRKDTPYALEIRSSLPVAATMSHFDFTGSTGEAFSSATSSTWTFANITKSADNFDFVVFYNTSDSDVKVTTTLYRTGGGTPIVISTQLGGKRRGGWNFAAETNIPDGVYAAVVTAPVPLVAARTRFASDGGGSGQLGIASAGATTGAVPTGQFGVNATDEQVSILNTSTQSAEVVFNFNLDNGESYRFTAVVAGQSRSGFNLSSLSGFPTGIPYAVAYESNVAVSVDSSSDAFGDSESSAFSTLAWSYWGFAEGFRPAGEFNTVVTEELKIYNPSEEDQLIEVKVRYSDGQTETVRQLVNAGLITSFNVHDFIQGARRQSNQFYSMTVKGAQPIVAFFDHSDDFFPGAFGLLGTPLGISSPV